MQRMKFLLVGFLVLMLTLSAKLYAEDLGKKIGDLADKEWTKLTNDIVKKNQLVQGKKTEEVIKNFDSYNGKFMIFHNVDIKQHFDADGNTYYYVKEPGLKAFVIEYIKELDQKLWRYNYAVGSLENSKWDFLARIDDMFEWDELKYVYTTAVAIRVKGKIAAIIKDDEFRFVGENLIEKALKGKEGNTFADVPKNLKQLPKNLAPLIVAKLYFYLSSVEKNRSLWEKLLCKESSEDSGINYWWEGLTKNLDVKYVLGYMDTDTPEKKTYYFIGRWPNGAESTYPTTVILENSEWKIYR